MDKPTEMLQPLTLENSIKIIAKHVRLPILTLILYVNEYLHSYKCRPPD